MILKSWLRALILAAILAVPAVAQDPPSRDVLTSLPIHRLVLPLGDAGRQMEVAVYLPHTYDPGVAYPVLVVPDADPLMGLLQTINFLWQEDQRAGPAILVKLPFGGTPDEIWVNRSYYLLPDSVGTVEYYGASLPLFNGGGAPELARFLREQVLPAVRDRYSVDSSRVGLAGFSMGGLFVAWHMVTHPGLFTDYVIVGPPISAPFVDAEFDRATDVVRRRGFDEPTRLFISYAEHDLTVVKEGARRWIERWQGSEARNLFFHAEVIPGLRHDSGAVPGLMNGYAFLYGK